MNKIDSFLPKDAIELIPFVNNVETVYNSFDLLV